MRDINSIQELSESDIFELLKLNKKDKIFAENIKINRMSGKDPYAKGDFRLNFYKEVMSDMYTDGL